MLSWQEPIGSTIVHVLDLVSGKAYTAEEKLRQLGVGYDRLFISPASVKFNRYRTGEVYREGAKRFMALRTLLLTRAGAFIIAL